MTLALGYDGKLYILAFDHRDSFQRKLVGIEGDPTPEQTAKVADAKHLVFEAMLKAVESGEVRGDEAGVLIDEQFGGEIPGHTKARGLKLSMPIERSGQAVFDFEYGTQFGEHIEHFDPDFSKVLVRYNPDGDAIANREQLAKLKQLADWLHERDRIFMFELMVPAERAQLESVDGDIDRYDSELRPALMRQAIAEIQDSGVEVDIWKIEGVDAREDAEMLAAQTRAGDGRVNDVCVLLGRGAEV
jgi:myo-inositol catabolism protein IolC